jgi:hypothetical protein
LGGLVGGMKYSPPFLCVLHPERSFRYGVGNNEMVVVVVVVTTTVMLVKWW